MAGRILTPDELWLACQGYAKSHGLEPSRSENGSITLMPGDILVSLKDGKMQCGDPDIALSIMECLPEATRGANLAVRGSEKGNALAPRRNGSNGVMEGSAIAAVRQCQSTEKATYSTGKGRKAASAKTNIAALMEMGGSLHIRDRIHKQDYIEYQVSASMGDQVVESGISIYKQEYLAKKAWEWIVKVLMDEPGIVTGTDEFGMPEFREGAQIKVRISDETQSVLVPLPAKIALWREMAREWQVAGRVCETKAYSRAADMLLRGDFQSKEELVEEQSEVRAIQEKDVAEAA